MWWFARVRPLFVVFVGVALGFVLSPSLSGCSNGEHTAVHRVLTPIVGPEFGLSSEAEKELGRFKQVYHSYAVDDGRTDNLGTFVEAFRYTRDNFVHNISDAELIDTAIGGVRKLEGEPGAIPADKVLEAALDEMLTKLDPHSGYMTPREYGDMQATTRGEFGGLGIEVTMDESGYVKVISPIEDTPAAKAGIEAGDLITHIDGEHIKDWALSDAVSHMRGHVGEPINITVKRAEKAPFQVRIVRDIINVRAVRWHMEDDIAYVRVTKFTEKVGSGVAEAFADLRRHEGPIRGLVLDLRNNPGGLLTQAWVLADAFLDDGPVVSIRGRDGRRNQTFEAERGDIAGGLPMVVLVNRGSASAAEIVSGALQDHGRAKVLGARTFGKGSVQTISPLGNGGAVRLTTSLYYLPSGRAIQAAGVSPDIIVQVEEPPAEAEVDGEPVHRYEADLPGALKPAARETLDQLRTEVDKESCPAAGENEDDRQLGCALVLLREGTTESFLAAVGNHGPM